jgi:hypothetical protein
MGRGRKRHRRPSAEAKALQTFKPQVVPDKKKDVAPEITFGEFRPDVAPEPELVQVMPGDVAEIWPLASALLAPEMSNIDWTEDQLRDACAEGQATLWMICDQDDNAIAAMVTILTPHQRCIVSICCGTSLWDYLEARHQLYEWAKEQGMKEVVFYGRPALAKLMPECKNAGVILRKGL